MPGTSSWKDGYADPDTPSELQLGLGTGLQINISIWILYKGPGREPTLPAKSEQPDSRTSALGLAKILANRALQSDSNFLKEIV